MAKLSHLLLGLASATALLPSTAVLAADYDQPIYVEQAPEHVPVEVGNGWYLRGDVGYQFEHSDRDNVFGTIATSSSDDRFPATFSGGIGYQFTDYLRMDATVGYLFGNEAKLGFDNPVSIGSASVDNSIWTAMLNGYVDLGTFAGLTPYIGGGVGVAWSKREYDYSENFLDPLVADRATLDRDRNFAFAYSLGAGASYAVTPNLSLDLGYLYTSAPNAEVARLTSANTYEIEKGFDAHEVKLGLRYALW